MKRMKIMVAAIALCGLAACSDNTPKSFTGTITDASMNTVTVENAEGTFTFSTMDADKSEANGLLLRRYAWGFPAFLCVTSLLAALAFAGAYTRADLETSRLLIVVAIAAFGFSAGTLK